MQKTRLAPLAFIVVVGCLTLTACVHVDIAKHTASAPLAVVLDTTRESRQAENKSPLNIPASVAILFIPANDPQNNSVAVTTLRQAADQLKAQLLANPKYISAVTVVPVEEGKISLERIRTLYATDVVILLSYQQDQRSRQAGAYGMLDVTIVGAFLVPGVVTVTTSVVDGYVVHVPNNAIIFRSSGMSERTARSSTYAEVSTAKEESLSGMKDATIDFGKNLTAALARFEQFDLAQAVPATFLTEGPQDNGTYQSANSYWDKVEKYKNTGGGAFGVIPLLLAAGVCALAVRRQ